MHFHLFIFRWKCAIILIYKNLYHIVVYWFSFKSKQQHNRFSHNSSSVHNTTCRIIFRYAYISSKHITQSICVSFDACLNLLIWFLFLFLFVFVCFFWGGVLYFKRIFIFLVSRSRILKILKMSSNSACFHFFFERESWIYQVFR